MKTYVGLNNTSKATEEIYVGYKNKAVSLWPLTGKTDRIYGAVWDGSADTSWTRTDDARGMADPTPQHAVSGGGWSTGSSPFDNIMPWSGMVVSEDTNAGIVVAIPRFYYKMGYADTTNNTGLKIQISMKKHPGFKTSPAHMDRGDGKGERDVVYVGRYHCASDYKSKTGVSFKGEITRNTARSGIHNLGATIWQNDYALFWTIRMLYLVEFADWSSQAKIGGGCSTSGSAMTLGYTDSMTYHTGTTATSIGREVYGGTQYRNIEGLWDNCFDWVDGIRESGSDVYIITNPSEFSDSTGGTKICTRSTVNGFCSSFVIPSVTGLEFALYPSGILGSDTTYISDYYFDNTSGVNCRVGGHSGQYQNNGLFYMMLNGKASNQYSDCSSRLMILP